MRKRMEAGETPLPDLSALGACERNTGVCAAIRRKGCGRMRNCPMYKYGDENIDGMVRRSRTRGNHDFLKDR